MTSTAPLINSKGSDHHYVNMGRWTTMIGVLISVGTAYLVMQFASIMDYVQALFSFFIAPLFGTVILGMLWKRATGPGGFWGLLCGTLSSIGMWAWVKVDPTALRYVALSPHAKALAQDMYQALWSFVVCVIVTVVVSLATKPMPDSRIGWPGLRGDGNSLGGGCPAVPEAAFLGWRGGGGFLCAEYYFLVSEVSGRPGKLNDAEVRSMISIWFFIGISLAVNGALICAAGIYQLINPPANPGVVLFNLHANVWWGAVLLLSDWSIA